MKATTRNLDSQNCAFAPVLAERIRPDLFITSADSKGIILFRTCSQRVFSISTLITGSNKNQRHPCAGTLMRMIW